MKNINNIEIKNIKDLAELLSILYKNKYTTTYVHKGNKTDPYGMWVSFKMRNDKAILTTNKGNEEFKDTDVFPYKEMMNFDFWLPEEILKFKLIASRLKKIFINKIIYKK